jgi:hypothetical protein
VRSSDFLNSASKEIRTSQGGKTPLDRKTEALRGGGIYFFGWRMVPGAAAAASGGPLLFAQYRPFAILKPKNLMATWLNEIGEAYQCGRFVACPIKTSIAANQCAKPKKSQQAHLH